MILDGNKPVYGMPLSVISHVSADQSFLGVAAASVLAKVSRDRLMVSYAESGKYPEFYDIFKKGKGYRHTQHHSNLIAQGIYTDLHRTTYNPLKTVLQGKIVTKSKTA